MRLISNVSGDYQSILDERNREVVNEQIFIYGASGAGKGLCISNSSLIKTPKGNLLLGKIKERKRFEVISYDFDKEKEVRDYAIRVKSGNKEVFEVETNSGKRIRSSEDHIFFVFKKGKIIEKKLNQLKLNDNLLIFE